MKEKKFNEVGVKEHERERGLTNFTAGFANVGRTLFGAAHVGPTCCLISVIPIGK